MARIVMGYVFKRCCLSSCTPVTWHSQQITPSRYAVMANIVMAYIVMTHIVMAYIVRACIVRACIIIAHMVMTYVVMAFIGTASR